MFISLSNAIGWLALIGSINLLVIVTTATLVHFFRAKSAIPVGDAIVIAAHQDDCLILAGEYALAAVDASKEVTIVYATCGDVTPRSTRSCQRKDESTVVWSHIGIGHEQLRFVELPQSHLDGPCVWTKNDHRRLRDELRDRFRDAPHGAAIIMPAAHESHVDHRACRAAAIDALLATSRLDLRIFECAEYNQLFNIVENPTKSLAYICGNIFLLSRIVRFLSLDLRPGFAAIGPLLQLPNSLDRQARKQQLMQYFTSEYNQLLAALARQPEVYREITNLHSNFSPCSPETLVGYFRVKHRLLHWSTAATWGSIAILCLSCSLHVFTGILAFSSSITTGFGAMCTGAFALEIWRWRRTPERQLVAAFGFTGGLIPLVVYLAS